MASWEELHLGHLAGIEFETLGAALRPARVSGKRLPDPKTGAVQSEERNDKTA